ncbi:ETX/MTX2 family pore-forming toxin [Lactococcus taiwanensis]|uniref:ETX/MTX2 family pore-forming toxin n=1 Tax=Lactococcus taiwanensis TaxID=1151742 RepID=A0AA45KG82_9LACT|nr:ETX/MTX2 family pore-forming toxin [Lactococcus taiwanensis]QSE76717.1 ETX/MTX2 family pore-forming toxin [Lactococcus taiwanensis]
MKKANLLLLTTAVVSLGSIGISSTHSFADSIEPKIYDQKTEVSQFYKNGIMAWSLFENGSFFKIGGFNGDTSFEFKDAKVTQEGDPTIQNQERLFVGTNNLTNETDVEQTLTTSSFSKTYTTTTSSTVTNGYQVGAIAKATFSIPLIGDTDITLSTTYNFATSETNTDAENITYTVPPQNIKVPAHTTAKVTVSLDTLKIRGNVKLNGTGFGTMKKVNIGTVSVGNVVTYHDYDIPCSEFLKDWELGKQMGLFTDNTPITNQGDGTFYLEGTGEYEAAYGSNFNVDVQFVDNESNKIVSQTNYSLRASQ